MSDWIWNKQRRDRKVKLFELVYFQKHAPEEVLELIQQTGPGYQRFRLYERYHELKKEQG